MNKDLTAESYTFAKTQTEAAFSRLISRFQKQTGLKVTNIILTPGEHYSLVKIDTNL